MKKFFLILFILVDLAAIVGAGLFLYDHLSRRAIATGPAKPQPLMPSHAPGGTLPVTGALPSTSTITPSPLLPAPSAPGGAQAGTFRNIGFTYKNAKARQVQIRADFTGWKGVPMKRDPHGIWSYSKQLTPGEYAYCFSVDGKIIKDPANKHNKLIAQTPVSSITVEKVGAVKTVEP